MKISRKLFFFITILFLFLPVSVHWRLILFGKHTKGIVISESKQRLEHIDLNEYNSKYCIIRFETDKEYIEFMGPEGINYPVGKKFLIFYSKKNPKHFLLFNFYGLFLTNKMIFPFVFFIMWIAFYLSFKENRKKETGSRFH